MNSHSESGKDAMMASEKQFAPGVAYPNGAQHTETPRPYYAPVGNEAAVFKAAYRQGLSVVLKGPTGCGKTQFVEAMAHELGRP